VLIDVMSTDFISHPLFIALIAHPHFLVSIARYIPVIATAPSAYYLSTFSAVMLSLQNVEFAAAYFAAFT
jgi:hypothetical protein